MNPQTRRPRRLIRAGDLPTLLQSLLSRRRHLLSRSGAVLLALFMLLRLVRLLRPSGRPKGLSPKTPAMATAREVADALPGFRSLSHQIFIRDPAAESGATPPPSSPTDPTAVLIYGWGDARPRHLSRYVAGYRALFPAARVVVVLSSIPHILLNSPATCATAMEPLVTGVFGPPREPDDVSGGAGEQRKHRVLVHAMSNTGAVNSAAALEAYKRYFPDIGPMPTPLVVLDSNPGSTDLAANAWKYGAAVAIGASRQTGAPRLVVQPVAAAFLVGIQAFSRVAWGRTSPENSIIVYNDPDVADPAARRVYVYSKEDPVIAWEDVEAAAEESRRKGWAANREVFEGTGHCDHMRKDPDRYWDIVSRNWAAAVQNCA